MIPLLPLQTDFEVSVPSGTRGQFWIAVLLLVLLGVAYVALKYRERYVGLSAAERQHKAALAGSKREATPRTLRLPADADPADHRADLAALFDRAAPAPDADRVTLRGAVSTVREAFGEAWRPVTDRTSRFVRRLVGLAFTVATLGAVAVSTDLLVRALGANTTIGAGSLLDRSLSVTADVADAGVAVLTSFPFVGTLWSVAVTVVTLALDWLYGHPLALAGALLAAAGVIAWLERRVDDDVQTRLYDPDRWLVAQWIGAFAAIWLAGAVPAGLGRVVGFPQAGALYGFVGAVVMAAILARYGLRRYLDRMRSVAHVARGADHAVRAYLWARRTAMLAAVPAGLLVVVYAAVIVAEGKLDRLWTAYLAADLGIKLLGVALVVGLAVGGLYQVRAAWPDVRGALFEATARTRVRVMLFRRGSIVLGVVVGYAVAYAYLSDIVAAIVLAAVGAGVGFGVYQLLERAKYRLVMYDREPRRPRAVVVQGYRLRDADGDEHPYAVVNGTIAVARESADATVDELVDAIVAVATGERYGPTVGTMHADGMLSYGHVDEGETRHRAWEHARKAILDTVRPIGRPVPKTEVEWACRDLPEDVWRARLRALRGDVVVEREETVELIDDPWRRHGEQSRWTRLGRSV